MSARAIAVANYLLQQCAKNGDPAVTPMQLIKLAYIAHGWTMGLTGKPLLDEQVAAWQYGPVIPSIYHAVKHFKSLPVSQLPTVPVAFSDDERNIMDQVAQKYGRFTGVQLSAMTHQLGTPWDITWKRSGKNAVISNDLIETFYKNKAVRDKDVLHADH